MKYNFENQSPTIISRDSVTRSILTGNQIIDSIFPLGKGQRQLIIGDQSTGKTSLTTTMILQQKNVNRLNTSQNNGKNRTFVIYISIGNKKSEVAQIGRTLKKNNCSWYTSIIYASSSESCASQYMVPFLGANLGEFIRDQGLDSLVILDDLTRHAISFQQLSLLMKKSPSRKAYPGDIFYLHSRLLERAAQMSRKNLYGSMTMIPIVETQQENFSAYIPTNIISITDGQIYLSRELYKSGIVPSTDILKSVSRIGAKAQLKILN
jgi:proton translocating ATP synthase F1 alpha subunit